MTLHTIILGAGSTGLLIAQGLKKNNINFTIYERDDEYKYSHCQRDWSMALLWGTHYLKNTLPEELLDRFDDIKSDPHDKPGPERKGFLPLYNGKNGDLIAKIPGGEAVRVNREKLRRYLSDDLDIQFGKVCSRIEENGDKITVTFTDGTTATADTVVCADGIKGVGRRTLLGEEKAALSEAPCSFVNICNKYKPEQARFIRDTLDTMYKFAMHPDQPTLFMIVPVDIPDLEHPEEWKYQTCLSTWGAKHADSNEERLRTFKEAASKFAEPWKSAVEWLPEDTYIPPDTIKYWANPEIWPNWAGKVTLAGDGAHPIVPFRAQGLNNALQDAHNYVQALVKVREGEFSLADAISAYGNEVLERCAAENKLSNMWGPVLHNWEAAMNTPMMKQGYGQTKKAETPKAEAKAEEQHVEKPAVVAGAEEVKASSPSSSESSIAPSSPAEETHAQQTTTEPITPSTPTPEPQEQPQQQPVVEKPTRLEPPSSPPAPATTLVHGQYTPTEEHKSPELIATTTHEDGCPLTPEPEHHPDHDEDSKMLLEQLKQENEVLRRRNELLIQKLKAVQVLVNVQEVDVDGV